MRHGSSVLRHKNCRCLRWSGGGPLDDCRSAVADCSLSDRLCACGDSGILGDDLLDRGCLRTCGQNAGVRLHNGLRGRGLRDSIPLKRACDNDRGALADRGIGNSRCGARVSDRWAGCGERLSKSRCEQNCRAASRGSQNHSCTVRRYGICWASSRGCLLDYACQNYRGAILGRCPNQSACRSGYGRGLSCGRNQNRAALQSACKNNRGSGQSRLCRCNNR